LPWPKGLPHTDEWKKEHAAILRERNSHAKPQLWNPEDLSEAVKASKSWTQLFALLGLKRTGGNQAPRRWIKRLGLSTEHFDAEWMPHHKTSDEEVFCEKSRHYHIAKRRFYARTPNICMVCGQDKTHNGRPLRFQVDHKNGNSTDCRWANLQKVCPNCHTQTDTYAGRNRVRMDGRYTHTRDGLLWCNECRRWKEEREFGNKASTPSKKQSCCNKCQETRRYRVPFKALLETWELQGGACPVCQNPIPFRQKMASCIDRDTATGELRGVLCPMCNHGLRDFQDSQIILTQAVNYLRRFEIARREKRGAG